MWHYAVLAFLPAALGCTNPDSNPCASFIKSQAATASPFCASFTQNVVTATTGLPAWATNCSSKPSMISKECSCYYTGGGGGGDPTPTTAVPTSFVTVTSEPPGPTQTAPNNCGAAPVNGLAGYGAGVTGGGSGSGTTVTSCSALSSALGSGGVIRISGMLSGCGVLDVPGGTTVIGVGANSGMTAGGLRLKNVSNVILRNLKIHHAQEGDDLIALTGSTKVWIDHCDLYNAGITGDKDYYDGLLDITHASDMITVSWTKFHDHWKGSLVGHSDSNGSEDTGHLRVTYHHNYWSNVNSRLPSLRFGTGHIYSSCFENCPTSGINSRMGAQVLVEQNYFNNVKLAITTNLDSDEEGYAISRNNIFVGSTTDITRTGSLSPPYSYVLDPASCICDLVKSQAGTGIIA